MQVTVRNPQAGRLGFMFTVPEFIEYQGDEVKLKWLRADQLALTTGDPDFPVRVIARELIVSIDGHSVLAAAAPSGQWVQGSGHNRYWVSGGTCTCTGYQYRGQCKHVKEAV